MADDSQNSPVRSRSRSASREPHKAYSRSRSRSPVRHAAVSPRPERTGEHEHWEEALESLVTDGKIKKGDLQESTLQSLKEMTTAEANYVLSRVKLSRLERIHNINGFIATIVKRTQREGMDDVEGDMAMLPRAVEKRLEALLGDGAVARSEIDKRICTALAELPPALAMDAVERFARTDLTSVRSKTGFMLSICQRVSREAREAIEREIRDSMHSAPAPPAHHHYGAPPPAYGAPAYGYDQRAAGYGYPPQPDARYGGYGR